MPLMPSSLEAPALRLASSVRSVSLPTFKSEADRLRNGLEWGSKLAGRLTESHLRYALGGKGPLLGIQNRTEAVRALQTRFLYGAQELAGKGAATTAKEILRDRSGVLKRFLQVMVARSSRIANPAEVVLSEQREAVAGLARRPELSSLLHATNARFNLGLAAQPISGPKLPNAMRAAPKLSLPLADLPNRPSFSPMDVAPPSAEEILRAQKQFLAGKPSAKYWSQDLVDAYESIPSSLHSRRYAEEVAKSSRPLPQLNLTSAERDRLETERLAEDARQLAMRGL